MKNSLLLATSLLVFCCFQSPSRAESPLAMDDAQVGRYQMILGPHQVVWVIDTATGQCWSRLLDGWNDEGNPTQRKRATQRKATAKKRTKRDQRPLSLAKPLDKVELTIKQRESRLIPGTDGQVFIRLDDITGGQVLISVHSKGGATLLDTVSAKQGDVVAFKVGYATVKCRIKEFKNFLTSEDIAILELTSSLKKLPAGKQLEASERDQSE